MAADQPAWTGVVLTGGASTRMGQDKALLEFHGEPMAVRVARELRDAGAADVLCVGGAIDELRALGLDAVADEHPGEGPLGGLLTAFAVSDTQQLLVAPCDLLMPSAAAFTRIVAALHTTNALAVIPVTNGVQQPLNGAYRAEAHAPLAAVFERGERSVKRALAAISIEVIDSIAATVLADADTPEDLVT